MRENTVICSKFKINYTNMLDFSQTNILKVAITWVGNKELQEGTVVPKRTLVTVNEYAHETLLTTFLKPFQKNEEFFYFHHAEDLSHNAVYQACVQIFADAETFSEQAVVLTDRLYNHVTVPKITGGEFFVVLFDAIGVQDETMPAIGMFKIVNKDSYLKVEKTPESFALQVGEGIATGKLALAALIFGTDEAEGYRIMATDSVTKKDTPSVWLTNFLDIQPIEDHYFNTRHYMQMTSDFINQKASDAFGLNPTDKIDLQNRSSFYFKENENFEVEDFAKSLFPDETHATVFKEFKEQYVEATAAPLADQFDISQQAVRKSSKVFKNVIKLDDSFKIYITGSQEWIERGFDEEKGKTFYKIYFEQEE